MSTAHTVKDYLGQAKHNEEVAEFIRKNRVDYLDWAATCLFYAAVHYINAYLRKNGIPIPRRHRGDAKGPGRTNIVQQERKLSTIYPHYRHLDDESRDARYELKKVSEKDFDNVLLPHLSEIKSFIVPQVRN